MFRWSGGEGVGGEVEKTLEGGFFEIPDFDDLVGRDMDAEGEAFTGISVDGVIGAEVIGIESCFGGAQFLAILVE